jgi:hypothetical protein
MPVCGNGVAETSGPGDFVCHEPCDGDDLREATCASIGHQGGSLACRADCVLDQSNCESCAPLDSHLRSCGANRQAGGPVALAAVDAAVALAFVNDGGLWVELLAPDLTTTMPASRIASSAAVDLDLIATPNGWLLAASSESIDVYSLDPTGALVSTSSVATGSLVGVAGPRVKLAQRFDGGAFVLWRSADGDGDDDMYVVALSADGSAVAPPTRVGTLVAPLVGAIPIPDGLLVAARLYAEDGSWNSELATVRIAATGAVAGPRQTVDEFGESPILAPATDGGAVLIYRDFQPGGSTLWLELDAEGTPEFAPIALDSELFSGVVTLLPADTGFDVIAPRASTIAPRASTTNPGVSWGIISDTGTLITPPVAVVRDPRITGARAARSGSDIIVAYQAFDAGVPSFALARIAP